MSYFFLFSQNPGELDNRVNCLLYVNNVLFLFLFSQTPGEFDNDVLCTNPAWHTALLAFKWLGLPYEVQHDDVRELA